MLQSFDVGMGIFPNDKIVMDSVRFNKLEMRINLLNDHIPTEYKISRIHNRKTYNILFFGFSNG